ncbi:unnamed protein product [Fusarium graminearum]|nr:unnamed protein product [Fusarium graminearum]
MNFGPGKEAKYQEKPGFLSLQVHLEGTCTCIFALTVSNPDPGVNITIGNECGQDFADEPQCWTQKPLSVKFGSSQCTMAVRAQEFDNKGGSATGFYLMIGGRKA